MASTIRQRLRRFNGTDYDTIYLSANVGDVVGILSTTNGGTGNSGVDTTPKANSTKMCTSGGIYTEINTLKTSVSEGKAAIASAITDKGVSTASDASFSTMATNIGKISFDFSGATIQASEVLSGEKGYDSAGTLVTGTMTNRGAYTATTSYGGSVTIPAGYHNGSGKITGGSFDFSGANVTVNDLPLDVYAWNASGQLIGRSFTNPLNTSNLTLGQHDVYFTAYPNIKWCVDHLDGNYVYLGLYNASETTIFGSSSTYAGSTIATKCTTYLNNNIPNVADYLESVTVHGVTNKVFIPSFHMFTGVTGFGDDSSVVFDWTKVSYNNRKACVSDWATINNIFWLSSPNGYAVLIIHSDGTYGNHSTYSTSSCGFRPEVKVKYKND